MAEVLRLKTEILLNTRERNRMSNVINNVFLFIVMVLWFAGIFIAKGFWSVTFSILFPPYALYLLVGHVMVLSGIAPTQ